MITKQVLSRILRNKYLTTYSEKECDRIAALMLKDDFPKNGITSWSKAFKYLDHVQNLRTF